MDEQLKKSDREQIERLFDALEAARVESDIQAGDRIFRDNPAPLPSDSLLQHTGRLVAGALRARGSRAALPMRRVLAAAAVLAVISAIGAYILFAPSGSSVAHVAAIGWEQPAEDDVYQTLSQEIEQLRDELLAAEFGDETVLEVTADAAGLELTLYEIDVEFWKG